VSSESFLAFHVRWVTRRHHSPDQAFPCRDAATRMMLNQPRMPRVGVMAPSNSASWAERTPTALEPRIPRSLANSSAVRRPRILARRDCGTRMKPATALSACFRSVDRSSSSRRSNQAAAECPNGESISSQRFPQSRSPEFAGEFDGAFVDRTIFLNVLNPIGALTAAMAIATRPTWSSSRSARSRRAPGSVRRKVSGYRWRIRAAAFNSLMSERSRATFSVQRQF
jgi:hypothetical protein